MTEEKNAGAGLRQWAEAAKAFRLPGWEALPELELYMDQVNVLLNRYLGDAALREGEEGQVTPSMINNYVKMGLIPRPHKKKYTRVHLAALIMICSLKNTHAIATIRTLLPDPMDEAAMEATYRAYVREHAAAVERFTEELAREDAPDAAIVIRAAVEAELGRSLTAYIGRACGRIEE